MDYAPRTRPPLLLPMSHEETSSTSAGGPISPQRPVDDPTDIQDECRNFLLDLDSGQRATEASPEQRVGMTLCRMRDLNTLLSRLLLALDRQLVAAATDTVKLQHLMRLQQKTTVEELEEAAHTAREMAEEVLREEKASPSSKPAVIPTTTTTTTDDDASGQCEAREHVPSPECDDAGGQTGTDGSTADGRDSATDSDGDTDGDWLANT